jgi:hypothetical protein
MVHKLWQTRGPCGVRHQVFQRLSLPFNGRPTKRQGCPAKKTSKFDVSEIIRRLIVFNVVYVL